MEGTPVNSMNFDDEDEGIPESPHSSLSTASDGQNTPLFNVASSLRSSSFSPNNTYTRAYSDTDSAYGGDYECLVHPPPPPPVDCHVLFFFLKSHRVSYDHLCRFLESSVTQVRRKRQGENSGFILKSLEQGGK